MTDKFVGKLHSIDKKARQGMQWIFTSVDEAQIRDLQDVFERRGGAYLLLV